jgi:hypothetical protein
MFKGGLGVISAFLMTVPMAVMAADTERVGAFLLVEDAPELIILAGDITPQTPLDFRTALTRRPDAKLVVLASDGGVVSSGLLLADDVHFRGLNTYIPGDARCLSACAYIFFAGKARLAEGELGVHQFYGGSDTAASAQLAMSDILDMLAKFETPQPVISRMLRTKSDDMYVFSRDEIAELAINRNPDDALVQTLALRTLPKDTFHFLPDEPSAVASAIPNAGLPPPPPQVRFALYNGVDFYGDDVGKVRVKDAGLCVVACMENKQCRAITFNTNKALKRGPNCFLKDGMGRGEAYEQAISGVFLLAGESDKIPVGNRFVSPTDIIVPD